MNIKNTNEIEVTIKTFYKENTIMLDINSDKFGEFEKIVHALAYIYDGEHKSFIKIYEEISKGNTDYLLENNHEPFIKVEPFQISNWQYTKKENN